MRTWSTGDVGAVLLRSASRLVLLLAQLLDHHRHVAGGCSRAPYAISAPPMSVDGSTTIASAPRVPIASLSSPVSTAPKNAPNRKM